MKAVMREKGIVFLEGITEIFPDLNPQENVWPWAETRLRKNEKRDDTFKDFGKRCLAAVDAYPAKDKLVASMASRVEKLIAAEGGPIRY